MKEKTTPGCILFYCTYLLCMFDAIVIGYSTIGDLPNMDMLSNVLKLVSVVLLLVKLVLDRYYIKADIFFFLGIGILMMISYMRSNYNHLFYFSVILLGIRNVPLSRLLRVDVAAKAVLCIIIISFCLFGISENYITYRTGSDVLRYSLGFSHPNTLASFVFMFVLEDAWIKRRRVSVFYIILIWFLCGCVYLLTRNRTAIFLMALFPIVLLLTRTGDESISKWKKVWLTLMFPLLSMLAYLFLRMAQSSQIVEMIDMLFSGRFVNASKLYQQYGIKLLGQNIQLISVKSARLNNSSIALLDVAYLRMLIQGGVIAFLVQMGIHIWVVRSVCELQCRYFIIILCFFLVFGLFESGFNNVFLNFSLLYVMKSVYVADYQLFE